MIERFCKNCRGLVEEKKILCNSCLKTSNKEIAKKSQKRIQDARDKYRENNPCNKKIVCNICNKRRGITFFLLDNKDDGKRSICSSCRKNNIEKLPDGQKRCRRCLEVKSSSEDFYTNQSATCKICRQLGKFAVRQDAARESWKNGSPDALKLAIITKESIKHQAKNDLAIQIETTRERQELNKTRVLLVKTLSKISKKKLLEREVEQKERFNNSIKNMGVCSSNKIMVISEASRHRRNKRRRIFNALGDVCSCCGESRKELLAIDHINGGGKQHRKQRNQQVYSDVLKSLQDYQLLCHNCNMSKSIHKECAHNCLPEIGTLKRTILNHYGDNCDCCGETNPSFLCLDHIDGGGNVERRETKLEGTRFYYYLMKNDFPRKDELRILCYNCNQSLSVYGYCPHHIIKKNQYAGAGQIFISESIHHKLPIFGIVV